VVDVLGSKKLAKSIIDWFGAAIKDALKEKKRFLR
jgi:hypothetical protein